MRPTKRKNPYPHKQRPKPTPIKEVVSSRGQLEKEPRDVFRPISREEAEGCLWSLAHVFVENREPQNWLIEAIPGITDPIPSKGPVAEKLARLERLIENVRRNRSVAYDQFYHLHTILGI